MVERIYELPASPEQYRAVLNHIFQDLLHLSRIWDPGVLDRLYYNREKDLHQLREFLRTFRRSRRNILITGDAGIGKSTFVYKCLLDESLKSEINIHPIFVDYRDLFSKGAMKKRFLDDLLEYFRTVGFPCLAGEVSETNLEDVKSTAIAHLSKLPIRPQDLKFPVVFLDDFDYIEEDLFPFLEWFIGFAALENCCLILSARPPLYAAANTYDNRFANYLTRHVSRVKLKPLTPYKVIAHRMAILLKRDEGHAYLDRLRTWWTNKRDPFRRWLKEEGIEDLEVLEESLHLPFTEEFCHFISATTNGNIREMLDLASVSLGYILDNFQTVPRVVEDYNGSEQERCVLTEEVLVELFGREAKDSVGSYRIINVHADRAEKTNASLLFNTLEAVEHFEAVSPAFRQAMGSMGHRRREIDWAMRHLQGKAVRMISPKGIYPSGTDAELNARYELTEKGKYYLANLTFWPGYRSAFGDEGSSLLQRLLS